VLSSDDVLPIVGAYVGAKEAPRRPAAAAS